MMYICRSHYNWTQIFQNNFRKCTESKSKHSFEQVMKGGSQKWSQLNLYQLLTVWGNIVNMEAVGTGHKINIIVKDIIKT